MEQIEADTVIIITLPNHPYKKGLIFPTWEDESTSGALIERAQKLALKAAEDSGSDYVVYQIMDFRDQD